jgi:DNA-binding NarL/FixJ family response regulator
MPNPKKRRILIGDDHPVVREGLRAILQSASDLAVCREAKNGRQAIAAGEKLQPDVAVVDISLRGGVDLPRPGPSIRAVVASRALKR